MTSPVVCCFAVHVTTCPSRKGHRGTLALSLRSLHGGSHLSSSLDASCSPSAAVPVLLGCNKKGNHKRHLRSETRASDRTITRTRPRVLTASTQTNLKASTTAQHHVHAHPAVGITSTEPGRKARPCKPGGRARPREIFETKTQTITKRKSRHAFDPLTHGLRSLRFRYASYRKRELLEVLRAVQDTRTWTEIRLVPVSRVQQMQGSRPFGTRMYTSRCMRSLWLYNASNRQQQLLKLLRDVQSTRSSTEVWLVPIP